MTQVFVGVGSNQYPKRHMRIAFKEVSMLGHNCRASSVYTSAPVCTDPNIDTARSKLYPELKFYNMVLSLETELGLDDFYQALKKIERKWGRSSKAKGDLLHTLDLDLLIFGQLSQAGKPELPSQDIQDYAFVLKPLAELAPHFYLSESDCDLAQLYNQRKPQLLGEPLSKVELKLTN